MTPLALAQSSTDPADTWFPAELENDVRQIEEEGVDAVLLLPRGRSVS